VALVIREKIICDGSSFRSTSFMCSWTRVPSHFRARKLTSGFRRLRLKSTESVKDGFEFAPDVVNHPGIPI
jgi:hypothetical protein